MPFIELEIRFEKKRIRVTIRFRYFF